MGLGYAQPYLIHFHFYQQDSATPNQYFNHSFSTDRFRLVEKL